MTINELIKTAHADAKAKGWWDEERNTGEILMLIVSECGEALEAHRSGKQAALDVFDMEVEPCMYYLSSGSAVRRTEIPKSVLVSSFEEHIKDSFSDELADIVIRIADFIGGEGLPIHPINREQSVESIQSGDLPETDNTGEALLDVVKELLSPKGGMGLRAWEAILAVGRIAAMHNIDLWRHIELKLAYNRTRPHRHDTAY